VAASGVDMIADFYTETAYVVTRTKPADFSTSTQALSKTTIRCAINPVSGNERIAGGKNSVYADYKLFCSDSVNLAEGKYIEWQSNTYNVVFVKDTFNMGHHKLAYLKAGEVK